MRSSGSGTESSSETDRAGSADEDGLAELDGGARDRTSGDRKGLYEGSLGVAHGVWNPEAEVRRVRNCFAGKVGAT